MRSYKKVNTIKVVDIVKMANKISPIRPIALRVINFLPSVSTAQSADIEFLSLYAAGPGCPVRRDGT
jgi:hypothetical protein